MPDEQPIYECAKELPEPYETVRVWFEDGTCKHATWTGDLWWCECREPKPGPVRWQRMVDVMPRH